ncbi:MAG: hypothetical protein DME19_01025, partial [Verrucomicrobia bacterium]
MAMALSRRRGTDFNNDGKPDLAVANYSSHDVSVLSGKGDGTFQAAVNYGVGVAAYSVAVGDFNGDNKPDLAIAKDGGVSILLGRGDGTFQVALGYGAGTNPNAVVKGDFNG